MESKESVGDVLTGEVEERKFAAGMVVGPFRDVVDFAMDGDPCVATFVVFLKFL